MESKQNSYLIDIITNSLLLTSILIIYGLLIYVIDISLYVKWWYGISVLIISVSLLIYFGINYRKSIGGILSYKDSFIYLYILSLFSALFQLIWGIVFFQIIDPELGDKLSQLVIESTVSMMEGFGTGGEAIDATIEQLEEDIPQSFTPIGQIKKILDQFYNRILAPIRSAIPMVRVGIAGLDLSPIILILGVNFVYPRVVNFIC